MALDKEIELSVEDLAKILHGYNKQNKQKMIGNPTGHWDSLLSEEKEHYINQALDFKMKLSKHHKFKKEIQEDLKPNSNRLKDIEDL